jgi:uncharacterized protein
LRKFEVIHVKLFHDRLHTGGYVLEFTNLPKGETRRGFLSPELGQPVEIPYIIIHGIRPGPTLLVTGGVHGAEYASIEAANRVATLEPETLSGTLIVLPVVNTLSFFARSIYLTPIDQKNLNRMFPGDPQGTFSQRLAYWLMEEFIRSADAHIDLHGGDMIEPLIPFTIFQENHSPSEALAKAFGIDLLIASDSPGTTCTEAAKAGTPCILAEAGGQGMWPEADIERLRLGTFRVMQHLGMVAGKPEPVATRLLTEFAWFRSEAKGFWYPYVTAGDTVHPGQKLGQVKTLLGETVQEVTSSMSGTVLFSVSSLAINPGDPLYGIGA